MLARCLAVVSFPALTFAQTLLAVHTQPPNSTGFGHALCLVPDADGDGREDLLVGAPGGGPAAPGSVQLRSSATGATLRTWPSPSSSLYFAKSVAVLGDIDGDGSADYLFGAPHRLGDGGSVFVHSGATGAVLLRIDDDGSGAVFGQSIACPGDVDGDAVPDFAVGDLFGGGGNGEVRLVSGVDGSELQRWTGDHLDDTFGTSIVAIDDLDGDGKRELAISAPTNIFGSTRGYVDIYSCATGQRLRRLLEPQPGGSFYGLSLASCPDRDGDGFGELIIGAPLGAPDFVDVRSPKTGALFLRWLEPSGFSHAGFGGAVASVGDVDGDGYDDFALVATEASRLDVHSGRNGTLLYTRSLSNANTDLATVIGGLDQDRDGFTDVLIGTPLSARVTIFRGFDTPSVRSYCVAKPSSIGCVARAVFDGLPTLGGADDFVARFTDVHNRVTGILYWGLSRTSSPFLGGTLCIQPPRQRTPTQSTGGNFGPLDCSGRIEFHFSHAYLLQHSLLAGSNVDVQAWFRDPAHPDGPNSGLTGGLEFTLQP